MMVTKMKSESNVKPKPISVCSCDDGMADIIFCEDITAEERDGVMIYSYREYRIRTVDRKGLADAVQSHAESWLALAMQEDAKAQAAALREERDRLLAASDMTQLADAPLTDREKQQWRAYRQALRDLPRQKGFPQCVEFPEKPKEER